MASEQEQTDKKATRQCVLYFTYALTKESRYSVIDLLFDFQFS